MADPKIVTGQINFEEYEMDDTVGLTKNSSFEESVQNNDRIALLLEDRRFEQIGSLNDHIRFSIAEIPLTCYAWTTYLREFYIELKTIDEFDFSFMSHFTVQSVGPIAAAQDHNWPDDVVLDYSLFTASGAHITTFSEMFRRECPFVLREIPARRMSSRVAWPIRNTETMNLKVTFRLRVTGC